MEQKRTALREKMNKLDKKKAKEVPKRTGNLRPQDLHLGDAVKVLSMNLKGTVSTRPDSKGNLFVQMGIMRTKVHISDLVLIDEAVITGPSISCTSSGKSKLSKAATISTEINLLGKTVDEAVAELDKYLDDAYLSHLPSCPRKRNGRTAERHSQLSAPPETRSGLPFSGIRRGRCRRYDCYV